LFSRTAAEYPRHRKRTGEFSQDNCRNCNPAQNKTTPAQQKQKYTRSVRLSTMPQSAV